VFSWVSSSSCFENGTNSPRNGAAVWAKKQLRISEPKKLSNNSCVVEPSREDTWQIRAQGEEVTLRWSGEACDATADEMEMIALRDAVVDIVENSEVYRSLPERVGAYE